MCGIIGFKAFKYKSDKFHEDINYLKQCSLDMKYRGPDDDGFWSDKKSTALGFRRLSIRDLSALRRLSFLLFVIMGFLALPDLIFGISGKPTAPIPVIIANLLTMGILLYGDKRGNI